MYDGYEMLWKFWVTPNVYLFGEIIINLKNDGSGEIIALGNDSQ